MLVGERPANRLLGRADGLVVDVPRDFRGSLEHEAGRLRARARALRWQLSAVLVPRRRGLAVGIENLVGRLPGVPHHVAWLPDRLARIGHAARSRERRPVQRDELLPRVRHGSGLRRIGRQIGGRRRRQRHLRRRRFGGLLRSGGLLPGGAVRRRSRAGRGERDHSDRRGYGDSHGCLVVRKCCRAAVDRAGIIAKVGSADERSFSG